MRLFGTWHNRALVQGEGMTKGDESDLVLRIQRIHRMNQAWKLATQRLGSDAPLSQALRDRKACNQVGLLRAFPDQVWLQNDEQTEADEPLLSVRFNLALSDRLAGRVDADHLPLRLAQELLTEDELARSLTK